MEAVGGFAKTEEEGAHGEESDSHMGLSTLGYVRTVDEIPGVHGTTSVRSDCLTSAIPWTLP